jgi:hypothetical protein
MPHLSETVAAPEVHSEGGMMHHGRGHIAAKTDGKARKCADSVAGELFQGALIHTLLCLQFLHF